LVCCDIADDKRVKKVFKSSGQWRVTSDETRVAQSSLYNPVAFRHLLVCSEALTAIGRNQRQDPGSAQGSSELEVCRKPQGGEENAGIMAAAMT
jgi:hypothetical protein